MKVLYIQWEFALLHICTFCLSGEHRLAKVTKRIAVWLLLWKEKAHLALAKHSILPSSDNRCLPLPSTGCSLTFNVEKPTPLKPLAVRSPLNWFWTPILPLICSLRVWQFMHISHTQREKTMRLSYNLYSKIRYRLHNVKDAYTTVIDLGCAVMKVPREFFLFLLFYVLFAVT